VTQLFTTTIVAHARVMVDELNRELVEHVALRNAAAECFRACLADPGSNAEFMARVACDSERETLLVEIGPTGVAAPGEVQVPPPLVLTAEQEAELQQRWDQDHPPVRLSESQLEELAARAAELRAQDAPAEKRGLLSRIGGA
jgi:hypothetical protein